jgi:acetylornithine deacetylase
MKLVNTVEMTAGAVELLRKKIAIKSFSGNEDEVANLICSHLSQHGIKFNRIVNNICCFAKGFDPARPTLMINSHLDTVRPSAGYTFDPFNPPAEPDRISGVGSNDAGASVVSIIETFKYFYERELNFNLIMVLSSEEENSGSQGIDLVIKEYPFITCAIIGEPTKMQAAVAERGLLVVDATAKGVSGHAAREEGVNAILKAIADIGIIQDFEFERNSGLMGRVKMSVTQIEAGTQHNVVPDICKFVIDIRPTDQYTNTEIMEILAVKLKSELKPRSLRNKCSITPSGHPLIKCAESCGINCYVSPTTSDWMRLSCPAIKMGPGDSSRSHKADEYVLVEEISSGISGYINFINNLNLKI